MEFLFVSEINRVEDAIVSKLEIFPNVFFCYLVYLKTGQSLGIFIKLTECKNAIPITDMEIFYDISMTETISIPCIA